MERPPGENRNDERLREQRQRLAELANKTPEDQEILLDFRELEDKSERSRALQLKQVVELATITVKSGAKNALSGKMISQFGELVDEIERKWACQEPDRHHREQLADSEEFLEEDSRRRIVLIRGHAGSFCSGSDLIGARHSAELGLALELAQAMQFNMGRLQQLAFFVVAHIEGLALGGGAELALAADMRLMAGDAGIGFVHSQMGVCCGWGGGARLVELVGPARAAELLTSGRLVRTEEALALGLAEQRADHLEAVEQFLVRHSVGSQRVSRSIKAMLWTARSQALAEALRAEAHLFAATWGRGPHLRALEANIKHRK